MNFFAVFLFIFITAVTFADAYCRSHSRARRSSGGSMGRRIYPQNMPMSSRPLHVGMGSGILGGGSGRGGGGNGGDFSLYAAEDDEDENDANIVATGSDMVTKGGILALLEAFADGYNSLLLKYTWPTKIISSAVVSALGDVLNQMIVLTKHSGTGSGILEIITNMDMRRLVVFSACGGLYFAPVIGAWFNWLNSLPIPKSFTALQRSLTLLSIDQTLGVVAVNGAFFFAFELINRIIPPYKEQYEMNILQAGYKSMREKLWVTAKTNYYCWPLINFINLRYIPLNYRLLFSNFAAVFWNMFLSSIAND